jgi:hypothetical protein
MGREDMLRHVPPYRETGALDDHAHLRKILRQRIRDRVLLRLIGKWLNAGALEGMTLSYPSGSTRPCSTCMSQKRTTASRERRDDSRILKMLSARGSQVAAESGAKGESSLHLAS